MSGNPILDWAILAVSLFNAILLAWLGLTVLLNSDRRRWGIWVAGLGMLLGAAFFVSHTALLGLGLLNLSWNTNLFWWSIGLLSAIALPFLWYVIMLWYAGYWEDTQSRLHRRQRPWLILTSFLLLLGIAGIVSGGISLGINSPRFGSWFRFLRFSDIGNPMVLLGFSFYMLLSIGLSLDALRNPGPSSRVMGHLARRRARPWLAGASIALLFVAVIVAMLMFWIGQQARHQLLAEVYYQIGQTLVRLDLVVSLLISVVIVFMGQAIVSYEIFTGKTLPRRGLRRQWKRALLLSGAISGLVAAALTLNIRPIYGLLLAALLMTLFFAMVSWRSYEERERLMESLRPFVSSQGLYNQIFTPINGISIDLSDPFFALCRDVLDAKLAYLVAARSMASLVDTPLIYPSGIQFEPSSLQPVLRHFDGTQAEPVPIDSDLYNGAVWAVPLWGERGLIGVLLLGEKRSGGLYTKEEMEIAAITGERIIDTLAGAEMARRLISLQRRHLAQTQVVDQQTRRVLHDEILPDLHAAMIGLAAAPNNGAGKNEELLLLLTGTHRQISDLLHELPAASSPEVGRLGLILALRRTVEQEYQSAFDDVEWFVEGGLSEQLRELPDLSASVIYYAAREVIRNAARYGRNPNSDQSFILTISVRFPTDKGRILSHGDNEIQFVIEDNGQGLPTQEALKQNGGQGLELHSTMLAIIGGDLSISSTAGEFTRVVLAFPA